MIEWNMFFKYFLESLTKSNLTPAFFIASRESESGILDVTTSVLVSLFGLQKFLVILVMLLTLNCHHLQI